MKIREAEVKTGLSRVQIRYWDQIGLININRVPFRKDSTRMDFSEQDIRLLRRVAKLLGAGIELRTAFELAQDDMTDLISPRKLVELRARKIMAEMEDE